MRDITVKDSTTHSGWLLIVLQMRTDKVVVRPPQNNMVLANTACRVIVVASVALNGKRPKTLKRCKGNRFKKKERVTWPKNQIHFTIFATQVVASQRWSRQVRVNIVFHIVKIEPFFPSGHTGRARIQICGPAWQANMMCDLCPVAFDV